jgi:hypothetical protein
MPLPRHASSTTTSPIQANDARSVVMRASPICSPPGAYTPYGRELAMERSIVARSRSFAQ